MCYIKKILFILFSQTNVWLYWECDMRMKGDLSKINTHTHLIVLAFNENSVYMFGGVVNKKCMIILTLILIII
jgi:hypothetical protein